MVDIDPARTGENTPGLGIINPSAFEGLPRQVNDPSVRGLVSALIGEMLTYHTDLKPEDRERFTRIQEELDPGSSKFNKPSKPDGL